MDPAEEMEEEIYELMEGMGQQSQTGARGGDGHGPQDELDFYDKISTPAAPGEPVVNESNLGLGFYSGKEYWQQVKSFLKGLYGFTAFRNKLVKKSIIEVQRRLGKQAFNNLGDEEKKELTQTRGFREKIREMGKKKWSELSDKKKQKYVTNWIPPHWRMMFFKHETSRSKDARLLDDIFGRHKELKKEVIASEKGSTGIFNRGD